MKRVKVSTSRSRPWSSGGWDGYNALIYSAAMQAVPQSLHEAAIIDGGHLAAAPSGRSPSGDQATIIFTSLVIVSTHARQPDAAERCCFGGGQPTGGTTPVPDADPLPVSGSRVRQF
ncbi:hypothetical protein [Nonomuraea dietziae]|uniref:hypothetical protein n=1 Tax=Nonomuraea dietziae TaxID=65515 RepID=UPI0031E0BE6C